MHIVPSTKILSKAELLAFSHIACEKIRLIDALVYKLGIIQSEKITLYYGPRSDYFITLDDNLFDDTDSLLLMTLKKYITPGFIPDHESFIPYCIEGDYFSSVELLADWVEQKPIDMKFYPTCFYYFNEMKGTVLKTIDLLDEKLDTKYPPFLRDLSIYLSAITDGDQRYILRFLEIIESELTAASHSA